MLLLVHLTTTQAASLIGFAELPADTFRPGPTSGQSIEAVNGRQPPFLNQQPVQGFSALLEDGNNAFYALSDNGFGKRENSADFLLCIYLVEPDFRTLNGGQGPILVKQVIQLSDPDHQMPYPITRSDDRLLTGADLDPESFQRGSDGSFWIGEEFGPSLVHFSASGDLLEPPVQLEGLASIDNPSGEAATLPRSRGFEGMAKSVDEKTLYPMLEAALLNTGAGLNIYTFNINTGQFANSNANEPTFRYRLDADASAIGDFTLFSDSAGLVIERDSKQGTGAVLKKIYRIDFEQLDPDGFLRKKLVVDLLKIGDPHDLNEDGQTEFTFPFWTIEALLVLNQTTLVIVNDNNYPFGQARDSQGSSPDNTEMIMLKVAPLWD